MKKTFFVILLANEKSQIVWFVYCLNKLKKTTNMEWQTRHLHHMIDPTMFNLVVPMLRMNLRASCHMPLAQIVYMVPQNGYVVN